MEVEEIDAEVIGIANLEDVSALVGFAPERDAVKKYPSTHHHDVKMVIVGMITFKRKQDFSFFGVVVSSA